MGERREKGESNPVDASLIITSRPQSFRLEQFLDREEVFRVVGRVLLEVGELDTRLGEECFSLSSHGTVQDFYKPSSLVTIKRQRGRWTNSA